MLDKSGPFLDAERDKQLTKMRNIEPFSIPGIEPASVSTEKPVFREAKPTDLMVDAAYQRNLTERSVTLIRKIVSNWDWAAFKPPVTVEVGDELHIVDGQHTATAASIHPEIDTIPVMVVRAEQQNSRASAFVKHNRDRVAVTPMQLHHSLLAAGDETSIDIDAACTRAGVRILKQPPAMGRFKIGETVAIAAIRALVNRRHVSGARQVLEICSKAMLAPISSDTIKAVEAILYHEEYKGSVEPEALTATLRAFSPEMAADVATFKAAHKVPRWRALAVVYFKKTRKKRRANR